MNASGIRYLPLIIALLLAACATRPEGISASYVSHEKYMGNDCAQLATNMTDATAELARLSSEQNIKANVDAATVFLVLIPASQLTGDHAGAIAKYKGEVEAIQTAQIKKNCKAFGPPGQSVQSTMPADSLQARRAESHATPVPAPTQFAALSDINSVPNLGENGRKLYREWLTKPFPRAVAISDVGAMARAYGPNAMQQAVQNCERLFGNPCRLYAVDDHVVWNPR